MNYGIIFVKLLIISVYLTFFVQPSYAFYTLHKAEKLDLSNNAILCMYQDPEGYMWFGTYDGLNLYNGKNTFVYRFEPDNNLSLCSNIIHKITQADSENLWVSTFLGLNKFSLKERKVTESYPEYPEAKLLAADHKGNTWIVSRKNYVSYYSSQTKSFQDFHLPGANIEDVLDVYIDAEDNLCMIMYDGKLKVVKTVNGKGESMNLRISDLQLHDKDLTYAYHEKNQIYFMDEDRRLYSCNQTGSSLTFLADLSPLINKYGAVLRVTVFNRDLYISFKGYGLVKIDIENSSSPELISCGIGIFCIHGDNKQDILWIGTDGQGVQMYYQGYEMFKTILLEDLSLNIQKPIRSIYADEYNNLWIGTKGDGIVRIKDYEQSHSKYIFPIECDHFTVDDGLSNNQVFCFERSEYHPSIIWIGTEGPGLSVYSYRDNKIRTLSGFMSEKIGKVHSICEVDASTLWLATAGNGLLEITIAEKNSQIIIESVNAFFLKKGDRICNEFHSMDYDGQSTLFIGSRGGYGVARFNIRDKQYDFIQLSKGENSAIGDVLCVHQSQDSIFYVGASSGMTKMQFLQNEKSIIKQFDRRDGIVNDMIHGMLEAPDGCIWLSTNKGLTKYNPHNDFFHNYSHSDLRVTEFSDDAYWQSSNNDKLFFGGINGLIWIEPGNIHQESYYKPELYFFDLKIGGERKALSSYTNEKNGHIELPHNTATFTISFVALDYINGDNYEYSYILEDFNTTWTELQKTNEITFTNFPYGTHTLKVKYKNDVFGSDQNYYVLQITKLHPWYLTNWAILGYIVLFLLVCMYIVHLVRRRIINKQKLLFQKIKEEEKEKLLEAKLNFFTNVTHEFFTPLTVINGISEHITKNTGTNEDLKKYTEVLRHNVNDLNELIQEILDFRKIEESKLKVDVIKRVSIKDLIIRHLESFKMIADQNQIHLTYTLPEDLYWNTDVSCFNRIFLNLISNAFKYTDKGGEVNISAYVDNERLILKVFNTGKGIEESKIPYIFDRYHILENMENGTVYSQMSSRNGIGLSICHSIVKMLEGDIQVKSEIDKYAEFIVSLPLLEVKSLSEEEKQPTAPDNTPALIVQEKISSSEALLKPVILVVDDNKDIVWLITDILSDEYTVKGTHTVADALKIVESQTPALIITDIMMPDVNGLELINRIKANKYTKHIPLIIISAKVSDAEQAEGLNVGADAYLTKPFSSIVLKSLIKRLLTTKEDLKDYYYSPESAYKYSDGQLIHQEDKEFMASVMTIINNNIEEENLRPELIAEKLGITTRNLYRRFKKIASLSPNDFIKDYRFTTAARLLITTNLTIQEIIYKVGINNKSYFYREFLKKYKVTPKEYRMMQ